MLRRILDKRQEEMLAENRRLLGELRKALARFDASAEDQETLERSARQLDELFLLVIAGEFNAGKSAFINALLGGKFLEEGVTPTTTRIHLIRHGDELQRETLEAALDRISIPSEILHDINIVDTPGTNAIHREHEAITREFVPRSDMVLFVTSADRPFTESERAFLQGIRDWGKKIVIVLNKIDILETPEDLERVLSFVSENAKTLLGETPDIFPVAARLALRGKTGNDPELLARSRFEALERYIVSTLDAQERVRLKLLNPLGVAEHLADQYLAITDQRLELLKEDFTTMEDIERQLALYKEDMQREFRFRLSDVDNVLQEFEKRGMAFFDETMRLARFLDLINKTKMKADFQRQVVADAPQLIERRVTEVIDWLVGADLRQWQAVMDHLQKRKTEHADRIVGQVGGSFDFNRSRLLDSVGRAAQRSVETYDREAEASRIAESVQVAVAGTALVEIGAIGLGAVLTHIAVTAAADFTGILAAGTIAVLGFFIIPNRRHDAKKELREKIEALRRHLMTSLTGQFDREIEASLRRIDEATGPYTRFVRAERDRLTEVHGELKAVDEALVRLRGRVEAL
ncbi:MAG TPA: dynamin family protein [Thermoanaerobaculia bacterium]|jgi:small GTP-binding protein|nr:dynamin family protein [Thermoanaerobaculia bacterium]